jgi:hypothetical protein
MAAFVLKIIAFRFELNLSSFAGAAHDFDCSD